MKALVFGANGQDGQYLCELLRLRGIEALGISRQGPWMHADVADFTQVEKLVGEHRPDYLFHLAANSTTRHDALFDHQTTIAGGALNVLEAVKRHAPQARVFLAGSGLQFENSGRPVTETDRFEASSTYSVARIQSAYAARYYRRLGVRAYVGYLFHHDSPRRGAKHVSQMIAQTARRIAAGSGETLEWGDVTVRKEWGFAGDIAAGMLALVEQEEVFEACIGTGEAYSIENWLEECFGLVNLNWRDHVRLREGFVPEYGCLVSNPATMLGLGWSPRVALPALAAMMMEADGPASP